MKGSAKGSLLKPMEFVSVKGESFQDGLSRTNTNEALEIVKWLGSNGSTLVRHYQELENKAALKEHRTEKRLQLSDLIAIVTPFKGQKALIQSALKKNNVDAGAITIGTVHALQGAERNVILFSSVYGVNDIGGSYFFDRGVNMLNVAVSRAKESFIVFGCPEVFQGGNGTPSSVLYRHIQTIEEHWHANSENFIFRD